VRDRPRAIEFPAPVAKALLVLALALAAVLRIWFAIHTHNTLEDSLITARYAENLVAGNGFVYNAGERILGTSTPLWTLLLAGGRIVCPFDIILLGKILGIAFSLLTLYLTFRALAGTSFLAAGIFAFFFAVNPDLIMVSSSGMETSLLLCSMSLAFVGWIEKTWLLPVGLAAVFLTRMDGLFFGGLLIVAGLFRDRQWYLRQGLATAALCAPWLVFAFLYFGSVIPQTIVAKAAVYHLDRMSSAAPFLGTFTPMGEQGLIKSVVKGVLSIFLGTGLIAAARAGLAYIALLAFFIVYCLSFMLSGGLIFSWYLAPPIFCSTMFLALGLAWIVRAWFSTRRQVAASAILTILLCAVFLSLLPARMSRYAELQDFEDHVRKETGLWLKQNTEAGSRIFLEPIGYIGFYAGNDRVILDEVGLVTPQVMPFRKMGSGWYKGALDSLQPRYVVQYTYSLDHNATEGTGVPLFSNPSEREWFFAQYQLIHEVKANRDYLQLAEKEKQYSIFRRKIP